MVGSDPLWNASGMPRVRRVLARALAKQGNIHTHIGRQSMRRPELASAGQNLVEKGSEYTRASQRMESAEMFWVTSEMRDLTLDASHDIPGIDWATVMPARDGLLAFEAPLPPFPLGGTGSAWGRTSEGVAAAVHGAVQPLLISWHSHDSAIRFHAWGRSADLEHPIWESEWWPVGEVVASAESMDFEDANSCGANDSAPEWPALRALLALIAATVTLMTLPNLASRTTIDPDRDIQRPSGSVTGPREVTLIDLRPLPTAPADNAAEPSGRRYRHRWIVRGHWRNQSVGQKHGERRITWVSSYVKGPEGAPIRLTDKVNVWRR